MQSLKWTSRLYEGRIRKGARSTIKSPPAHAWGMREARSWPSRHFRRNRERRPPLRWQWSRFLHFYVSRFLVRVLSLLSLTLSHCCVEELAKDDYCGETDRCEAIDREVEKDTMDHGHAMQMESPFVMPQEDVEALHSSQAFCALRRHLAGDAEYVTLLPSPLKLAPSIAIPNPSHPHNKTRS